MNVKGNPNILDILGISRIEQDDDNNHTFLGIEMEAQNSRQILEEGGALDKLPVSNSITYTGLDEPSGSNPIVEEDETSDEPPSANPVIEDTVLDEPSLLHAHQESIPSNDINISNTKFQCNVCLKSFFNTSNLKRHQRIHTGKMVSCPAYQTKHDLLRHTQSVHEGLLFKCDVADCKKTFQSKTGLENHKRHHNGNYKYLCQFCGKGFNYKTDYIGHQNKHQDSQPYSCFNCEQAFRFKSNLNRHSATCGKTDKKFGCDHCGKRFKCKRYLKDHMVVHEDPEKFQCSQCGNFFKHRSSLYKHVKKTGHK